jgi:hypothetical protein
MIDLFEYLILGVDVIDLLEVYDLALLQNFDSGIGSISFVLGQFDSAKKTNPDSPDK